MADYQRILSYLYRYDNGQKKECKGFIKAEQRPEELKLTIQIEDDRLMEDMQFQLCFYQRQPTGAPVPVEPSKHLESSRPLEPSRQSGDAVHLESPADSAESITSEEEAEHWQWNCIDRVEIHRQREELTKVYPRAALPPSFNIERQSGVLLYYQDALYYGSVWIGEEIPAVEIPQTEKRISKQTSQLIYGESVPEKPEYVEPMPVESTSEKPVAGESAREENPVAKLSASEAPTEKVEKEEPEAETRPMEQRVPDYLDRIRQEAEPVTHIFNPAFYEGYQIIDRQLPRLGPDAERLSSNQFLRDGYERHRHLLVGKVRCGGEDRYCVGVPGVYDNREKYMAQLYQFPIFLALTENRIKTGGPGYWLHLLPREEGRSSRTDEKR